MANDGSCRLATSEPLGADLKVLRSGQSVTGERLRVWLPLLLPCLLALSLLLPVDAGANDRGLRLTLATWSRRLGAEPRQIRRDALQRKPRLLIVSAGRFRGDSLRALRALTVERPSSGKGTRARKLALASFRDYVGVGRQWLLSGQARLRGRKALAVRYARLASSLARRANLLLIASGRVLG